MGVIRVGTSSWANASLVKDSDFYPPTVRTAEERLRFYATQFPLVEVDSTFYRLPTERLIATWDERTPPDFVFNVKAFRVFTLHPCPPGMLPADVRGALPLPAASKPNVYWYDLPAELQTDLWERFERALRPLHRTGKLGAVLLQFPPWVLPSNQSRQHMLDARRALAEYRLAIEFRDVSWVSQKNIERTMEFLAQNNLTFVCVDEPQIGRTLPPIVRVTTPDLAIVRLHGRNADAWKRRAESAAERSRYLYEERELREWVPRLEELADRTAETHAVFNNAYRDYAVRNARQLIALLERAELPVRMMHIPAHAEREVGDAEVWSGATA
jgi:uncharacterized protein YecE (DUF72 family)